MDQIRVCRAHIEQQNWKYLTAYTDHAVSGASTLRPGYQKLLEDARSHDFDVVVAEALDRLSRDQADIANLYKQLSFLDIQLVTLAEGEISELHVGLKGTMNALFLKDLAQKTRRGLEGRVRQGKSGGGLCYGYDVVREVDANGEPIRGGRRINEPEAEVVRRIFAEFAGSRSPRAIAKGLNAEAIAGPHGRAWRDTAIRGHATRGTGILRNQLYIGRLIWNRQRFVKDPATGKRLARPNPREDWVIHDVPELRIVDDELWQKVQARLDTIRDSDAVRKARKTRFWERRRAKHLLTGLVACGECDSRFASVGRDYLACSGARGRGTCSNTRSIKRAVLEDVILDGLKDRLMHPDLVKEFISAFHAEINQYRQQLDVERKAKERDLVQVARRLDGLIEAIADGLRTPGLKAKLEDLERRKAELEQELAKPHVSAPRLHPNLAELYSQKVAALQETLRDPKLRDEALDLLRNLIDQVVMRPIENGFKIELVGDIAHMVEFANDHAQSKKRAALDEAARCSVKVVAGAGFGLNLLFTARGLRPHSLQFG
jgi:DNA invertase Pin-like site-specific DNA recombinase